MKNELTVSVTVNLALEPFPAKIFGQFKSMSSSSSSFFLIGSSSFIYESSVFLLLASSILSILCPVYLLSLLCTCAKYPSLASLTLSPNRSTRPASLIYSFLIVSILVTPSENLGIFNSATSSKACCLFISVTISKPHSGSRYHLVNLPFALSPDTELNQLHPTLPSPSLLHLSCALSVTLDGWPQILKTHSPSLPRT